MTVSNFRPLTVLCLVAILLLVPGQGAADDVSDAAQTTWRQAHIEKVVTELSGRDTTHLTPAQRDARTRALAALKAYGKRGVFPRNHIDAYRGLSIPYFIDARGTRCAFAHLLDVSGADDLLHRLARERNNAFVPAVQTDTQLRTWLTRNGFTVEEIAFIQAPGYVDPGPATPGTNVGLPTTSSSNGGGTTTGNAAARPTWESWWRLNRHAFLNLRRAYHDAAVVTPTPGPNEAPSRGHRPSRENIDSVIVPFLAEQARPAKGRQTQATALMAWARAASAEQAPAALDAVLAYLRSPQSQYRDLVVLALGLLDTQKSFDALVEIVRDTKRGRRLLGRSQSLNEETRALAALALSETGRVEAIPVLEKVLEARQKRLPDLRASAVASLGLLGRQATDDVRSAVAQRLTKAWKKGRWPDAALAEVPIALGRMGYAPGAKALTETIDRFRKPVLVRQNSALTLGHLATKFDKATADTLIGTVRRDPDAATRAHALMSLGELAARLGGDDAVENKLARFYAAGFKGVHLNRTETPWLLFSSALYVRGFPKQRETVVRQLQRTAEKDASRENRAAAVVALALANDRSAIPSLRKMLAKTGDDRLRGFLAESLGILKDKSSASALLALVTKDKSEHVRYHAAVGLGFLADRALVPSLIEALPKVGSLSVQAALARVVGELGDGAAVPQLIALAKNANESKWTRRRAIAALGMIADDGDDVWTADLKRGGNWAAATPTLRQVMSIF